MNLEVIIKAVLGVLLAFLLLILITKAIAVYKANKLKGRRLEGFPKGKLFLYFFSPKCGACISMERELSKLKGVKLKRIDVSVKENLSLAKKLGILATPTLVLIDNGVVKEVLIGIQKSERLEELFHNEA